MTPISDPTKRILLDNLPKLLRGYGRRLKGYDNNFKEAVLLVCDLDNRNLNEFLNELSAVLHGCQPKPDAHFCIAIEEGEAWYLGDLSAIKSAFPGAKDDVLSSYINDSICGTWEKLADAVYPGGAKCLSEKGWRAVGAEKSKWAEKIPPYMDINNNNSQSFCFFRKTVRDLAE